MIQKKKFRNKIAMLCMIGMFIIGQSFNVLAAQQYVYSAERGNGPNLGENQITSYLIGRMNTTFSACLGIQVNGIYSIRGSGRVVEKRGTDFFKRAIDTQVSAMATYTVSVDSHINYCGVRCLGYYAYSPSSAVSAFAFQDIDV